MSTGVGKRIRQRRKELGLSQEELAARMGFKSKQSVSNVEIGRDNLTTDRVTAFAQALDCSESYLMGWEDIEIKEERFKPENAILVAKVSKDLELLEALKVYFSLSEDKKKYAVNLIKMLGD